MRNHVMLALMLWAGTALAQQSRFTAVNENAVDAAFFQNRFKPQSFKLFSLNLNALQADLAAAPAEKTTAAAQSAAVISLPTPEGMQRFRVVDAPVMEPGLAARYPGIHSYIGVGIENPSARARFSTSPQGFQGMITGNGLSTVYISQAGNYYITYSRKDADNRTGGFNCLTKDEINPATLSLSSSLLRNADDGNLRTYRLALCASGEYSQFWLNGTETTDAERKAKVLAAMNNAITRLNGIYERDFNVRVVLIANNDAVIYLNASTDPFTTSGSWNSQTQTTCTNVIGAANYDVGHAITYTAPPGNGNAGCIGCVCLASKGSGWSAYFDFASDFFVVDYLTHEMGHQFGATHTHTYRATAEGTDTQVEPGSGSTIMSYAGITGATTDVQPHNDDYFNSKNIEQVTNYVKSTNGNCAVVTATGNNIPTANAGADYVIPRSTPFMLTGTGTDADAGDVLSYCWEQIDNRATGYSTIPSATATAGPQFRSYLPVAGGSRVFPKLSSILDGTNANKWEVIPSVARTLNFRFTVRDNRPGGGANKSDDMALTINAATGPFLVTAPALPITWSVGSSQTVTWSVNGTSGAPVNCANVKISLSTDGGNTFPVVLAAGTPNDGSETIVVPDNQSTACRIKVEAEGNIFFDISNVDFTIAPAAPCADVSGLITSGITTSDATLSWSAVTDAISYDVDYKTSAATAWTNAATGITATSASLSGLAGGTSYLWRVRNNCAAGSGYYALAAFSTLAPCNNPTGLTSSFITATSATLGWTAISGASNYTVEYKANTSTTWTTAAAVTTATSVTVTGLTAATLYDWRVRTNCTGNNSSFVQAQFTTAAASACPGSHDVSTNGSASGAATIPFNTDIKGLINTSTDNDYYRFVITTGGTATITLTTLPANYDIRLYSSNGTTQLASSANTGTTSETISRTYTAGTYFVRVLGVSGANNSTLCYTLRVQLGTASRETEFTGIDAVKQTAELFPNPAKNQVNVWVNGYTGRSSVQVFDLFGKQVMQQPVTDGQNELNTGSLPAGIYMVRVLNNNTEVKMIKFVKE